MSSLDLFNAGVVILKYLNPRTGAIETRQESLLPRFSHNRINALRKLLQVGYYENNKTTAWKNMPSPENFETWIAEQELAGQEIIKNIHDKAFNLKNLDIAINLNDSHLSIFGMLEVMERDNMLYNRAQGENIFINEFKSRQNLPTGPIVILSNKLMMHGRNIQYMEDQIALINKAIGRAGAYQATLQGVVSGLQYHQQSEEVRTEMNNSKVSGQYTLDITSSGHIAGLRYQTRNSDDRVGVSTWLGNGDPNAGCRVAVFESEN